MSKCDSSELSPHLICRVEQIVECPVGHPANRLQSATAVRSEHDQSSACCVVHRCPAGCAPSDEAGSATVASDTPVESESPATEPPVETDAPPETQAPVDTDAAGTGAYDFSAIDPIVSEFVAAEGLNGAGLIIVDADDGVVHEDYWGDFSADRISLIASSSKMVAAGVLLRLQDDGLLDIDTPVAEVTGWEGNPEITTA